MSAVRMWREMNTVVTQPLFVCSAALVCRMELPAFLSLVYLAKPLWKHRQRCMPWWFQWSLAGSEDGPPVWTNLCGR